MKSSKPFLTALPVICILLGSCQSQTNDSTATGAATGTGVDTARSAAVTAVTSSGVSGAYSLTVTIESPDTGCEQYADWWEVFSPDGTLIYRRILAHSHVNEQPFTRSGGPVSVSADDEIIVRAHMNNSGYGEQVFRGTVSQGFNQQTLASNVAEDLALTEPLPSDCPF